MVYVFLCKVLYDYIVMVEDELMFIEDVLLYVLDVEDLEWWKVKLKVGENEMDEDDEGLIGLILVNYVEEFEFVWISKVFYDYVK